MKCTSNHVALFLWRRRKLSGGIIHFLRGDCPRYWVKWLLTWNILRASPAAHSTRWTQCFNNSNVSKGPAFFRSSCVLQRQSFSLAFDISRSLIENVRAHHHSLSILLDLISTPYEPYSNLIYFLNSCVEISNFAEFK